MLHEVDEDVEHLRRGLDARRSREGVQLRVIAREHLASTSTHRHCAKVARATKMWGGREKELLAANKRKNGEPAPGRLAVEPWDGMLSEDLCTCVVYSVVFTSSE